MMFNICMKFHQDILKGFQVIEETLFCNRCCYVRSSNGQELWFLHSARCHMVLNICMKFHENILKGFKAIVRTKFKGASLKKYMSKSYGSCALHVVQC